MGTKVQVFGWLMLCIGALFLQGCAGVYDPFDPYEGVPIGAYHFGNQPFTQASLTAQDQAEAGCYRWADETNPSDARMMTAFAANGFVGGGLGGASGNAAASGILGVTITGTNVAAAGASYALAAGFVNAGSGHIYHAVLIHSDVRWCKMAAAAGWHFIAPSDVERLRRGEVEEIAVAPVPLEVLRRASITSVAPTTPAP